MERCTLIPTKIAFLAVAIVILGCNSSKNIPRQDIDHTISEKAYKFSLYSVAIDTLYWKSLGCSEKFINQSKSKVYFEPQTFASDIIHGCIGTQVFQGNEQAINLLKDYIINDGTLTPRLAELKYRGPVFFKLLLIHSKKEGIFSDDPYIEMNLYAFRCLKESIKSINGVDFETWRSSREIDRRLDILSVDVEIWDWYRRKRYAEFIEEEYKNGNVVLKDYGEY